jgi:23S rRNA (adenine2503-C2)-methyltransferase
MMGMGEPLNNYENVRNALRAYIEDMEIGRTKITLSTVGVKRGMEYILSDADWPDVRVAISLHYADQQKRKEHMPVANQRSIEELKDWCLRYLKKYGNRKHHITFEYLMLEGKNDGPEDVKALIHFLRGIDRFKINLIPWNVVGNLHYNRASRERTERFQSELKKQGIICTIRKSLGIEIDAGCGQLAVKDELVQLL